MYVSIDFKSTPYILKKGGALLVAGKLLGNTAVSQGLFAGLSVLAIVAAMNDTNGGLYMALMGQFGRKEVRFTLMGSVKTAKPSATRSPER